MLKEIIRETELNGGITYDYLKECKVLAGYAVSMFPEREMSMPILDEKSLIFFIHTNYSLLIKEENYLGIWYNEINVMAKNKGYYIFDVVRVVSDVREALHIAWKNNQKAIYDLDKQREIFVDSEQV